MQRLMAARPGNMLDLQKINEMLREEGFQVGEVLPFGDDSHLFILFKPVEEKEDWSPGDDDEEEQ